jgi:hypothetical protein
MFDHIDDIIRTSMKTAEECANGKIGVRKAATVAKNAYNAVKAIETDFRSQQDKYKVHNVPWTRKRPAEKTEVNVAKRSNLKRARAAK